MVVTREMVTREISYDQVSELKESEFDITQYINDIPLLVEDSDDESGATSFGGIDEESVWRELGETSGVITGNSTSIATATTTSTSPSTATSTSTSTSPSTATSTSTNTTTTTCSSSGEETSPNSQPKISSLPQSQIKQQRNQIMMTIVKYVSIKITNLFPPTSSQSKISLEKFLVIMINRLKLSLPNFLKALIYLFRYMDIIYLLRYLNQSNNYANFNEMDFPLKKLIIGCFKLTLLKERVHKNWYKLCGLKDNEINVIIKTILKRLNNKVNIKEGEIVRFKTEVYRYVKSVSQVV